MEQAQRSPASTPQLSEDTRSRSNKQRRRTGLHVSLNNCDDVLCFLEDFGALVCKAHHTAVVNLDAHLLQHHGVPAATRKLVVERFRHHCTVNPADMELPDEPAQVIEELGKPLDGLRCRTCKFTTVNINAMRMHCKKDHQQAWRGDTSSLYDAVTVQSFFRTGGLQRYFVVDVAEARDVENAGVEERVEAQLAEYRLTR